jgi:hypothetical protein
VKVSPETQGHGLGLLFGWEQSRSGRLKITTFILGSLAFHALCFYAFQIIYPPAVALLPPPGRVTVIAPNTAEGRVLLNWLEAEDPALASTTQPSEQKPHTLPKADHAPSYMSHQPVLRDMPASVASVGIPSVHPPGAVEPVRGPRPAVTQTSPTVVHFSTELEALNPAAAPPTSFTASKPEPPMAARFRVAVSGRGDIRNCFLEASSGDMALDQQARSYLVLCRFSTKQEAEEMVWGSATIEWGNDVSMPSPAATGGLMP